MNINHLDKESIFRNFETWKRGLIEFGTSRWERIFGERERSQRWRRANNELTAAGRARVDGSSPGARARVSDSISLIKELFRRATPGDDAGWWRRGYDFLEGEIFVARASFRGCLYLCKKFNAEPTPRLDDTFTRNSFIIKVSSLRVLIERELEFLGLMECL